MIAMAKRKWLAAAQTALFLAFVLVLATIDAHELAGKHPVPYIAALGLCAAGGAWLERRHHREDTL